jgi:hypothetical protein
VQAPLGIYRVLQSQTSLYKYETLAIMHSANTKQRTLVTIRTCNSNQKVYYHNNSTHQSKRQQFTVKWSLFITIKRWMDNRTSIGVCTDVMRSKYDINIFCCEEKEMYTQLKHLFQNSSDYLTSSHFTFTNK